MLGGGRDDLDGANPTVSGITFKVDSITTHLQVFVSTHIECNRVTRNHDRNIIYFHRPLFQSGAMTPPRRQPFRSTPVAKPPSPSPIQSAAPMTPPAKSPPAVPLDAFHQATQVYADATQAMQSTLETTLNIATKDLATALAEASQQMEYEARAIAAKQAEWRELEGRVQSALASIPTLVTLDVGGVLFKVPKETLLSVEGSYFHALLGSGFWTPDAPNEAYFVDVHAGTFDRVLVFLRTGTLWLDGLSHFDTHQLRTSMAYLNLTAAVSLAWDPTMCSTEIVLSRGNATATKPTNGAWNYVLGNVTATSFRLRVDTTNGQSIAVGFCRRDLFAPDRLPVSGYYLNLSNGHKFEVPSGSGAQYCGTGFGVGDVVTARISDAGSIHFAKNDQDLGVAFQDVEDTWSTELYPVVAMGNGGAVTILSR
ncbi:Aste57867_15034 [Aphanomyces stellatus]|uniref:Aste57867_15034 protein n=1 Tax=Aphanomyces stellatus TaxID=120398 RepID=A0A485L2S5_9STRA|nr:hypothetical protein As57867_014978 [Aphanomyces stellatus]VFT91848.1 Aste57867_15034 [Aphanomyces stellatus]